jgi:hypothetical protein
MHAISLIDVIALVLVYVGLCVACGLVRRFIGRPDRGDFSETQKPWRIAKGTQHVAGRPTSAD